MKTGYMIAIVFAASLAIVGQVLASEVQAQDENGPDNRFATELLDTHNQERARFGAKPLRWSPKLASQAQQWAQLLASEGRMRHASNDERNGAGENLWMGTAGRYSAQFMLDAFIEEKQYFRAGTFPNISRTGNWRDVGHYTQVVWHDTQQVGCAVTRNDRDDFLVCRYWPAGNTYGVEIREIPNR